MPRRPLHTAAVRLAALCLAVVIGFGDSRAQGPPPADGPTRAGLRLTCPRVVGDTAAVSLAPASVRAGEVTPGSIFEVRFTDSVPAEAEAAIAYAASIWEGYLRSSVPIVIDVDWRNRDEADLLASAGPATLYRDFPGALPDTWYPVALAEAITGTRLNEIGEADIDVVVNAAASW